MKALLAFTSIQIMVYIFSMSNAITISLIVLGSAVIIFTGVYISALIKDKRHQRKSVDAVWNYNKYSSIFKILFYY